MTIKREIFENYAKLKIEEARIAEEIMDSKEAIMIQMQTFDENQIELKELGIFIKVRRKLWKYTPAVKIAEDAWKDKKAEEQAKGTATFEESLSFMFRANRSE